MAEAWSRDATHVSCSVTTAATGAGLQPFASEPQAGRVIVWTSRPAHPGARPKEPAMPRSAPQRPRPAARVDAIIALIDRALDEYDGHRPEGGARPVAFPDAA
jgi:hypothetical protein